MSNDPRHERLEARDPESLSDREKLLLLTYRTQKLEDRVDGLFKAMWTIAGTIGAGVAVFFLTSGRPAAAAAFGWLLG